MLFIWSLPIGFPTWHARRIVAMTTARYSMGAFSSPTFLVGGHTLIFLVGLSCRFFRTLNRFDRCNLNDWSTQAHWMGGILGRATDPMEEARHSHLAGQTLTSSGSIVCVSSCFCVPVVLIRNAAVMSRLRGDGHAARKEAACTRASQTRSVSRSLNRAYVVVVVDCLRLQGKLP